MALATSCPRCQTSFRVVPDQLKIRRGLVRCGACQHVFSGIDSLRYIDEPTAASSSQDRAAASATEIARLIDAETARQPGARSPAIDSMDPRSRAPVYVQIEQPAATSFESLASGAAPADLSQPEGPAGLPPDAAPAAALSWSGEAPAEIGLDGEVKSDSPSRPEAAIALALEAPPEPGSDAPDTPTDPPSLGPALDLALEPQFATPTDYEGSAALLDSSPDPLGAALLDASPDALAATSQDTSFGSTQTALSDDSDAGADNTQRLPGFDPLSFADSQLSDEPDDRSADALAIDTTNPPPARGASTGVGPANEDWLLEPIGDAGVSSLPVAGQFDTGECGADGKLDDRTTASHANAPANDTTARNDASPSIWIDASQPPPGDTVIVIDAPSHRDGWAANDWSAPDDGGVAVSGRAVEPGTDWRAPGDTFERDTVRGRDELRPFDDDERAAAGSPDSRSDADADSVHEPAAHTASAETASADSALGGSALAGSALGGSALAGSALAGSALASPGSATPGGTGAGGDPDAVDFFAAPSRARGFTSRTNAFAVMACVVLSVALLVQVALAARDWLAAWVPALEPTLSAMSGLAGLQVQAPRSLAALTLESFELQAGTVPGVLNMSALLRNRAGHIVRWPGMELTLTDGSGTVIVRKVLLPTDYLGRGLPAAGVPAGVEQNLTVSLEGLDLQPTGYNVKLFYP